MSNVVWPVSMEQTGDMQKRLAERREDEWTPRTGVTPWVQLDGVLRRLSRLRWTLGESMHCAGALSHGRKGQGESLALSEPGEGRVREEAGDDELG
jgi:hypothetical protein